MSLSVRFLYYNTISYFIKNNKIFIIETIPIFIQLIKLLSNQWISSKTLSFQWKDMFIFSAGQSSICIIPFWNLSRNINSFRQIRVLAIFCTRLQSSFCPSHETFLSEHKLHFMKILQSFLFSKFIFYICIFILIIFRTVIIFPRHRMVSKSYLFYGRRKPSFQHLLNL